MMEAGSGATLVVRFMLTYPRLKGPRAPLAVYLVGRFTPLSGTNSGDRTARSNEFLEQTGESHGV
jgi:hypothetical protein